MAIDVNLAAQKYSEATPASVNRYVQGAVNNANKFYQNATSQEAENNYKIGVETSVRNQSRLRGLQNTSPQDYANGIQQSAAIYQQKTAAAGGKWGAKFEPYARVIDQVTSTLQPKISGDIQGNIMKRVVPIALALNDAKTRGVSGTALGVPQPINNSYSPVGPYGR